MTEVGRIGQRYGDYEVLALLGQGGMGEVFAAHQLNLDRRVAIKFISQRHYQDELNRKRFLREIRTCSALQHPNIIKIYDYGEHGREIYLVMELLEGEPLEAYIKKAPQGLPQEFVLKVGEDILSSLAYMHPMGFIHRDIKPANVFITRFNRAVLMDFGLVKTSRDAQLTLGGKLVGTPRYLPPEVLVGGIADHRGDLYQVGLFMCEALTGKLHYRQREMLNYLRGDTKTPPKSFSQACKGLPEPLVTFLENALSINTEERYQDADQMIQYLVSARDGGPVFRLRERPLTRFPRVFPDLELAAEFVDRYQFRKYVSKDRLLSIVHALDSKTKREVDIHFLSSRLFTSSEQVRSLLDDLERLAKIQDPNLETPLRMGLEGEVLWLVFPHRVDPSLAEFLQITPVLSPPVVAGILLQVCHGLMILHRSDICLGYLNASGITVDPDGTAKLIGLEMGPLVTHTLLGERHQAVLGFSYFSAPEILEGEKPTVATDVFSVGALGYRLLTGTFGETWDGGQFELPSALAQATGTVSLEETFLKCLARDPEMRNLGLGAIARRLVPFCESGSERRVVATALGTKPEQRSRRLSVRQTVDIDSSDGRPFVARVMMCILTLLVLSGLLLATKLELAPGPPADLDLKAGKREILITWTSEQAYASKIELGQNPKSLEVIDSSNGTPQKKHSVKVSGLKPGSNYVFRIVLPDSRSTFQQFRTRPE